MFSTSFFAAAAASLSLISSSVATYNPTSQRNVAMYWGSGSNQLPLAHFCNQTTVDTIIVGFVNLFPPQANGLVAQTFGNQCWDGNYTGPGYNGKNIPGHNYLYERCPQLQEDLIYCQKYTDKKILLSLGGAVGDYSLNGAADGVYLANFIWGAYGPYDSSWTGVRPLDRGLYNTDTTEHVDFDGFDFDIEHTSPDQQAGYIAAVKQLRSLIASHKASKPCSKEYIISGAPQCPLDEPYMSTTIQAAQFDMLFIQFYNNPSCSARNFAKSVSTGSTNGFNYDGWVSKLAGGASSGAKLYLGLLGGAAGSVSAPGDYLSLSEATTLISKYHSHAQFGGVMLYEATVAENNAQYYAGIKNILNNNAAAGTVTSTTKACSSTTSSASSTSISKSSSTSSKASTTSSTSSSKSSTSPVTSTSKSSTSSPISTSTSKSSIASSSASKTSSSLSTKSSTSRTSSSVTTADEVDTSSSSVSPSSSSASTTLSSVSSDSVSSTTELSTSASTTLSSTSSTSETSTSASSTSVVYPTTVPSVGSCAFIGCYTEATSVRALSGATNVNYDLMSVEICAAFCSDFTYFGLEYGGECYCGDSLGDGSVLAPESECNMACDGTAGELCGAGNRLDVYQCGGSVTSTVSGTSTSTGAGVTSTSSSEVTPTSSSETVSSTSSATETSTSEIISSTSSSATEASTSSSATETSTSATETSTSSYSSETSTISSTSSTETSTSYSSTETSTSETSTSYSSSASETASTTSESVTSTSTSESGTTTSFSSTSSPTATATTSSYSNSTISSYSSSTSVYTSETQSSNGTLTSTTLYSSSTLPPYANSSTTYSGSVTSSTPTLTGTDTYTPTITTTGSTYSASSSSSSASVTQYTTSTVYTTSVHTITSCAATVTNCPAHSTVLTTETIPLYTTVCPVTATETSISASGSGSTYIASSTPPSQSGYSSSQSVTEYTTSTVYATSVYTITSCAPSVTNCPARIGSVTTEVVALYTTICPVTATETSPPLSSSTSYAFSSALALPGKGGKSTVTYPAEGNGGQSASATYPADDHKTTTISSTVTTYKTVQYVESTATVIAIPVSSSAVGGVGKAPYPTGSGSATESGKGTGVSSGFVKASGYPVVSGAGNKGVSSSSATATPSAYVTSGAASARFGGSLGVVLAGIVLGAGLL